MLTIYGQPGVPYNKARFTREAKALAKAHNSIEFTAVAEPFSSERAISNYHIHIWMQFNKEDKRKNITSALLKKCKQIVKLTSDCPDVCLKYTKCSYTTKKANLNKIVNDALYSSGQSVKSKDKFDVVQSRGFNTLLSILQASLLEATAEAEDPLAFIKNDFLYKLVYEDKDCITQVEDAKDHFDSEVARMQLEPHPENAKKGKDLYDKFKDLLSNRQQYKKLQAEYHAHQRDVKHAEYLETPIIPKGWQPAGLALHESEPLREPNNRKDARMIVGPGGVGKSKLQDLIFQKERHNHIELKCSSTADIAYAYTGEGSVTFNLAKRTDMDKVNYAVIEDMLDGKLFSKKYESQCKHFAPPRVTIFANNLPRWDAMSPDRWDVYRIVGDQLVPVPVPTYKYNPEKIVPVLLKPTDIFGNPTKKRKLIHEAMSTMSM